MACRRSGDKPLSEPMMVSLLTHICIIRPQWVKWCFKLLEIWWFIQPLKQAKNEENVKYPHLWGVTSHWCIHIMTPLWHALTDRLPFIQSANITKFDTEMIKNILIIRLQNLIQCCKILKYMKQNNRNYLGTVTQIKYLYIPGESVLLMHHWCQICNWEKISICLCWSLA